MKKIISISLLSCILINTFAQQNFTILNTPDTAGVFSIAISPCNDIYYGTFLKGLYVKKNEDIDWRFCGLENTSVYSVAFINNTHLLVGTNKGIYEKNDTSQWQQLFEYNDNFISIIYDTNYILAGTWRAIFKSGDNGATWIKVLNLTESDVVNAFLKLPNERILAGVSGYEGGGAVYYSDDMGDTWYIAGIEQALIKKFAIDSHNIIYVIDHRYSAIGGGLYRSLDNGMSWERILAISSSTDVVVTQDDNIYVAGTDRWIGVNRSLNGGATWEYFDDGSINSFEAIELGNDGYLYAQCSNYLGGKAGLYKSKEPISTDIQKENLNNVEFLIYPNPFSDFIQLKINVKQNNIKNLQINIIDISGRIIEQKIKQKIPCGVYNETINLINLPSGIYFFQIKIENQQLVNKLIKN